MATEREMGGSAHPPVRTRHKVAGPLRGGLLDLDREEHKLLGQVSTWMPNPDSPVCYPGPRDRQGSLEPRGLPDGFWHLFADPREILDLAIRGLDPNGAALRDHAIRALVVGTHSG